MNELMVIMLNMELCLISNIYIINESVFREYFFSFSYRLTRIKA